MDSWNYWNPLGLVGASFPDNRVFKISTQTMNISLCTGCFCMTKTIKGLCGKCGAKKIEVGDLFRQGDKVAPITAICHSDSNPHQDPGWDAVVTEFDDCVWSPTRQSLEWNGKEWQLK
jgi:hypothetical protein